MSCQSKIILDKNDSLGYYQKELVEYEKSSQLFAYNLIEYTIDSSNEEYIQAMYEGYRFMAEINLELSELTCEQEFTDINEYEKWLCGV